jgi:hypothetical protein
MTDRREFLAAAAGGVGLAGLLSTETAQGHVAPIDETGSRRMIYELKHVHFDTDAQKDAYAAFVRDALIPAYKKMDIGPVGAFEPTAITGPTMAKDAKFITLVVPHKTAGSVLASTAALMADTEFLSNGAAVIDAPADKPAFRRIEASLLLAFKGMPAIATPVTNEGRVLQLRVYESPSTKTGLKKIEMFNDAGEIPLFKKVGLNAVFFGQAIVGPHMPNLTYMLGFESKDALDTAWKTFVASPEWQKLKGMAEYSDKAILSGITNILMKPIAGSQI